LARNHSLKLVLGNCRTGYCDMVFDWG